MPTNNGYSDGSLDWTKLPKYSNNKINFIDSKDVTSTFTEAMARSVIDSDITTNGNPVIIKTQYFNSRTATTTDHFVVAKGKLGNSYAINDPASSTVLRLDQGLGPNHAPYPILGIRRIGINDGRPIPRFTAIGHSPIQLLLIDPTSKETGFDPTNTQIKFEISSSSYFEDRVDSDDEITAHVGPVKFLDIVKPSGGQYNLEVIGEGVGTYSLDINITDNNGNSTGTTVFGVTDSGNISTFSTNVSTTPGQALVVKRKATIPSTRADILAAFKLKLIDSKGIANSMLQKLDTAQTQINQGNISAARTTLMDLKSQIMAQGGKHISKDVATILLEDINDILNSSPFTMAMALKSLLASLFYTLSDLSRLLDNLLK
jgi:hypothetical protein